MDFKASQTLTRLVTEMEDLKDANRALAQGIYDLLQSVTTQQTLDFEGLFFHYHQAELILRYYGIELPKLPDIENLHFSRKEG